MVIPKPQRAPDASLAAALEACDREQRWRLLLGSEAEGRDAPDAPAGLPSLPPGAPSLAEVDALLEALYAPEDPSLPRSADLAASRPRLSRWLGDVRRLFPRDVVRVVQQDALARKGPGALLLEPELLAALEPSVELVATLLSLSHLIPERSRDAARELVARLAGELTARLGEPLTGAVRGALARAPASPVRTLASLDVHRTLRHNLRHTDPVGRTPRIERLFFHGQRAARVPFQLVIALDSSGSMAGSLIHGAITASVLSRLPSLQTHLVLFDTAVADLTERLDDPVDVLLGAQLGGGTDIAGAVGYCGSLIDDPSRALLLLITDLHEGGAPGALATQLLGLRERGVTTVCLLALDDAGVPAFDEARAGEVRALGVPTFATTPGRLPELLAAALRGEALETFEAAGDAPPVGRRQRRADR